MRRYRVCVLLCAFLAMSVHVLAQERPVADKPPTGQVGGLNFFDAAEVTVVNLDVSVLKKGNVVYGLQVSDFEVFQDGKPQDVTNFAFISRKAAVPGGTPSALPAPTAAPTPAPLVPREPRFLVVYVDNENIAPFNRNRVLNRLDEFIRSHLVAPDQAMVVSYQKSLKVVQRFTTSADDVIDALRPLRTYTGGRSSMDSERREIEDAIEDAGEQSGQQEQVLGRVRGFAREQHNNLMFTVGALQELVHMTAGLPGKKAVVYVSDGLPMVPGLELFYAVQDRWNNLSVITQSMEYDATSMFRGLATSATAAGVTFYTIDARGLESEMGIDAEYRQSRSTMAASMARSNYQDSLLYMANQTGGMAVVNTNDVKVGLDRIAEQLENYYWIGYRLVPSGKDRPHRVEVKVKGHPDYTLNYRRTFIEKSLPTQIGDRVISGLVFDLEDNPLGVALEGGEPMPASSGRWTLPVEVRVPIDKVALIPDGSDLAGYLMVYYAARDDEGKQSDLQRVEHAVRIPVTDYEKAQRQVFTFTASLLLEPGIYRISVGVRDQLNNQAGYAVLRKPVHPEERR